jgi:hypothetical protein
MTSPPVGTSRPRYHACAVAADQRAAGRPERDVHHENAAGSLEAAGFRDGRGDVERADAEAGVADLARLGQFGDDPADHLGGDGELGVVAGPGAVDADDAAVEGHERPARVPGVDGRVRLDGVGDGEAVTRRYRSEGPRDDAGGDGAIEPHRVAERRDGTAGRGALVDEFQRRRVRREVLDGDDGEVRVGVRADDAPAPPVALAEPEVDLGRVADDVLVRDDVGPVVDEAGSGAAATPVVALRGDVDRDDRRDGLAVEPFVRLGVCRVCHQFRPAAVGRTYPKLGGGYI